MTPLLKELQAELRKKADRKYKRDWDDQVSYWLGVRTPIVRKLSSKYFKIIQEEPKYRVFRLCEELLKTGLAENKTIAFDWAHRLKNQYEPKDFQVFARWAGRYVSNWGDCDDFCTHALGEFLLEHPRFLPKVFSWTKAKKWPLRRVSAVALIYPLRKGKYLKEAFKTADTLMMDQKDLVQKGYGWMLKEGTARFRQPVFRYVLKHKARMPRTALRYAIEKLPPKMKREAMSRNSGR